MTLFSGPDTKPMESQTQTRVSKRAPREFRNWRVQGNPLTLRQHPVPTLRQPFAKHSPTLCQPFLPTPLQAPLSVGPRHEKASAIARMRQKCVRHASEMRQKCVRNVSTWVLFHWEKRNVPKRVRSQNCVKNVSKMRGTPLGKNTF